MKYPDDFINKIICGDCLEILKEIPDESIDMVITSPPYWGLRRYGDYKEQIGLEPTFSEYLDKIMVIMKEIKRVVKKEGQIWVNIGDCYASNGPEETRFWHGNNVGKHKLSNDNYAGRARCKNYQSKCLLMVPERFAMRCIDELGLILRNKIKWAKQVLIKKENRTKGSVMPTCLSPETEVYIKDEVGIVAPHKLKELLAWNTENLQILSPTGWKKIKNVWRVEKNKTIKFKVGSSSEIECSLQHKFPISHDNRRKRYEIKEAQNLRIGKNKMLDRFLFVPIEKFLPNDTELELNYKWGKFIGLYAAEGGFVDYSKFKSYQGKFTLAKYEDNLANDIKWGLNKFEIKYKENFIKNYRTIVFSSKDIKNFISKFVIGKCKEKRLDMVAILNTNKEFRKGVFDGIIAGDGHIDKNKRITFGSASKQLRDNLYLLASSIGLLASKYDGHNKDKRTNKIYNSYYLVIPISLQKEKLVGERECIKGKPLTAKYKNEFKAKTLKFSNPEVIEDNKWLIDIEVEDGLFLINGGIVSHNSVKDRFNESGEELYFFVKNKKYYSDLDAVRLPNQVMGVTDMRAEGFVRSAELYYNSKYNQAEGQGKIDGASRFGKNTKKYKTGYEGGRKMRKCPSPNELYKKIESRKRWKGQREAGLPATYIGPTGEDHNLLNNPLGKNLPTIWLIGSEPHNFKKELDVDVDHFAIFPQALLEIPIKFGCPKDGIVLDPFMGSGTTAIVAKKLGRNFVGIELNPQYIKIAEARIKSISKSLSL